MTNHQIVDLPLNGRDYLQLARISAGVLPPPTAEFFANSQGVSVGGSQQGQVNFLLDGVDNNNQSIAGQGLQKEAIKPQIDAIGEFKIVTNAYSAEYGRSLGGVVTVTTKLGTNQIHGSAFEFLRNEDLDARNFFAPPGQAKPPLKRNQYGFSAGGPVKKNRSFLFGDMEWSDIRESVVQVQTVPNAALRAGDFAGEGNTIHDPLTYNATANSRQPFANNAIPDSRIDRVSRIVRDWWPQPTSGSTARNHTFVPPNTSDVNRWDVRYDQIVNDHNNFYLRFSGQQVDQLAGQTRAIPDSSDGLYLPGRDLDVTSRHLAVVYNAIFLPNLVGSFRAGMSYIDTKLNPRQLEAVNPLIGVDMGHGLDRGVPGSAGFRPAGGWSRLTGNGFFNFINSQTRQVSGDLTWTAGRHTVKFGQASYWLQSNIHNSQNIKGTFAFNPLFTSNPTGGVGEGLADFLLGVPFSTTTTNYASMALRAPWSQTYIQDDWRLTDRLTVNLGLRYELNLPWVDSFNGIANMDIDTDPAVNRLVQPFERGNGRFSRALVDTDGNNFAPRVGFAYRVSDATVIRGAAGIYYANVMNTGGGQFMQTNQPNHVSSAIVSGPITPRVNVQDGLTDSLSPANIRGLRSSSFEIDAPWPMSSQWNLNIQRQLPGNIVWEIGYFGTRGTHIVRRDDFNFVNPATRARRWQSVTFPGTEIEVPLGPMWTFRNDANSIYHALQTKLEKRFGNGLSFLGSYAWSKNIGDVSRHPSEDSLAGRAESQNPNNRRAERSLLSHHVKHRFAASYLYELPFDRGQGFGASAPKSVQLLFGGWTFGGIANLMSGFPMSVLSRGNPSGSGGNNRDRPNVVGEWRLPASERDPSLWWNPDAFERNASRTFGNAGRNILEAPGTVKFDLTLHKNFQPTEKVRLQFRVDAFNAFNHPIFRGPNPIVGNRNFGIVSVAAPGRVMQFGLKVIW
jgi:hypothetical protein